jgi:hypothetical protein
MTVPPDVSATVTAADLGTYLDATVDPVRATLLLGLAQTLCLSIVNPLPAGAEAVILDVAARAYGNPGNVASQGAGGFTVGYGPFSGGLRLTRQNKATLQRLAGGGGAFTVDFLPRVSAVQLVTVLGSPTGGSFTLSYNGQVSGPIAYNASAGAAQAALQAVPTIGAGNATVTGGAGAPYTVTFGGLLAATPVPLLGADGTGLTGGTSPSVLVTQLVAGAVTAGQGLPPWDTGVYGGAWADDGQGWL